MQIDSHVKVLIDYRQIHQFFPHQLVLLVWFAKIFPSKIFQCTVYTDCGEFDAVTYWPALYLVVGISISYIVIPYL